MYYAHISIHLCARGIHCVYIYVYLVVVYLEAHVVCHCVGLDSSCMGGLFSATIECCSKVRTYHIGLQKGLPFCTCTLYITPGPLLSAQIELPCVSGERRLCPCVTLKIRPAQLGSFHLHNMQYVMVLSPA